jgi:hypothetical protein
MINVTDASNYLLALPIAACLNDLGHVSFPGLWDQSTCLSDLFFFSQSDPGYKLVSKD